MLLLAPIIAQFLVKEGLRQTAEATLREAVVQMKTLEAAEAHELAARFQDIADRMEASNSSQRVDLLRDRIENNTRYRKLKELLRDRPETAADQTAWMEELNDSQPKGQVGECIAEVQMRQVCDPATIETGKEVGHNELDFFGTTNENATFQHLTVENGQVVTKEYRVPEGTNIAMEVKNGDLDYLQKQMNGRLPGQVEAGVREAGECGESFVGINMDAANRMVVKTEAAYKFIADIEVRGGKVVIVLPRFNEQKRLILKVMEVS
jgi:hypothetical protein